MQEPRISVAVAAIVLCAGAARGEPPAITAGFRGDGAFRLVGVLGDYPRRHAAEINAASFSPDGRLLATAGGDRRIKLWDAATGEELFELGPAKGRAYALVFSPDGKRLAVASSSGVLTLWNLERRGIERSLAGHGAAVLAAAFSPSGDRLASAGRDQTIRIWNPATGAETVKVSVAAIRLEFRGDDTLVATTADGQLMSLRAADGTAAARAPIPQSLLDRIGPTTAAALSPDGSLALAGAADGTVSLHDGRGRRWKIGAHTAEVTAVAFSPDGTRLCSASRDTRFALWDLAGKLALAPPAGHQAAVPAVAFAGEDRLVSGGADGQLRVWNLDRGDQAHHFALGGGTVWAVATAGSTALAGTDDGRIHALDLLRSRAIGAVLAHAGGVFALAAAHGRILSAGADGHGRVWEPHLRRALVSRSALASAGAAAIASGRIAVGFDDGVARVYDLPAATVVARLPHDGLVLGAAFRSDGRLVTACEDDSVRVWDIDGASPTIVWTHAAPAVAVVVGPDDVVVSAGADGVVATPDARLDLSSAGDSPLSLAFSPSGRTFAVGTRRGVILLYQR